jgi:hypothetical protein
MIHGPDEPLQRHLRTQNNIHSLGVVSDTVAKLEWYSEGWALTAADQPMIKVAHFTAPGRDEEEHGRYGLRAPLHLGLLVQISLWSIDGLFDERNGEIFGQCRQRLRALVGVTSGSMIRL